MLFLFQKSMSRNFMIFTALFAACSFQYRNWAPNAARFLLVMFIFMGALITSIKLHLITQNASFNWQNKTKNSVYIAARQAFSNILASSQLIFITTVDKTQKMYSKTLWNFLRIFFFSLHFSIDSESRM